jgi:hypothetical protein
MAVAPYAYNSLRILNRGGTRGGHLRRFIRRSRQLNKGLTLAIAEWQDINRQSKQSFVTV